MGLQPTALCETTRGARYADDGEGNSPASPQHHCPPPAWQHHLCGPSLVPGSLHTRKRMTERGTKVEGACGQNGVQGKSGMGRSAGWHGDTGWGCLWLRGSPTPWDCSSVRPGVVTRWKRDTLNPALGSLSRVRVSYKAASLQGVRSRPITDKVMWGPGDNSTGRSRKYTAQKSPLYCTRRVAGRIYNSSTNSTDAFTKLGIPPAPSTAGARLGGRLRHCCPRAATGGTTQRAGARLAAGAQAPQNLLALPPPHGSGTPIISVQCREQGGRGRGIRLVRMMANAPPPCPFRDKKTKTQRGQGSA